MFAAELNGGVETVSVAVPGDALAGDTFSRFRISRDGGLGPLGLADNGEVEDYGVKVFATAPARDFGDVPDASYGTTRASFGPSHVIGGPLTRDDGRQRVRRLDQCHGDRRRVG